MGYTKWEELDQIVTRHTELMFRSVICPHLGSQRGKKEMVCGCKLLEMVIDQRWRAVPDLSYRVQCYTLFPSRTEGMDSKPFQLK